MRTILPILTVALVAGCPLPVPLPQVVTCQTDSECRPAFECRLPDDGRCITANCPVGAVCPPVCDGKLCQPRRSDAGVTDAAVRDAGVDRCASFEPPCQSDFDCRGGQACLPPEDRRCAPSACGACDPATGSAICTRDCNGKICRARTATDAGANLCAGFEPPCRSDAQCGPGRACLRDPSQCNPSACGCDPATGDIICTDDCGGGVCGVPSSDAGRPDAGLCVGFRAPCANDSQCVRGEQCVRPSGVCQPSACSCGPNGIVCTTDCNGGVCQPRDAGVIDAGSPDGGFCVGFVPPCSNDAMCGPGNRCVRDPNQCNPSACGCDPATGSIVCTADCSGGVCRPQASDAGACVGFEPPCSSNAMCGAGRVCRRDPTQCVPSACGCDPTSGAIICTSDCGGGQCTTVADAGTPDAGFCANFDPPCSSNAQCRPGTTCRPPPNACTPSACGCDPSTGNITCTADCGGRRCLP
jgi:hypothetical protein